MCFMVLQYLGGEPQLDRNKTAGPMEGAGPDANGLLEAAGG